MTDQVRPLKLKVIPELEPELKWEDFAEGYPGTGEVGVTYRRDVILESDGVKEALLYYASDGNLVGIFEFVPNDFTPPDPSMKFCIERAGTFNVIVNPKS